MVLHTYFINLKFVSVMDHSCTNTSECVVMHLCAGFPPRFCMGLYKYPQVEFRWSKIKRDPEFSESVITFTFLSVFVLRYYKIPSFCWLICRSYFSVIETIAFLNMVCFHSSYHRHRCWILCFYVRSDTANSWLAVPM